MRCSRVTVIFRAVPFSRSTPFWVRVGLGSVPVKDCLFIDVCAAASVTVLGECYHEVVPDLGVFFF